MNSFLVFSKKEWTENVRTKKLYILMGIFVFFGMVSPAVARYMADILRMATNDAMAITIAPTTWVDGWAQFYGNISQVGGLCVIFLFMNCIVGEKQSGSAALTLTKNLSHSSFVLSKFISAALTFTLSFVLGGLVCFAYTYYLYGHAGKLGAVFMGMLAYCVFIYTLLGITMLASTITKSTPTAAMLSFCGFIILGLSSAIPAIGQMLPGALLSKAVEFSSNGVASGFLGALIISACLSAFCLFCAIRILERQEI